MPTLTIQHLKIAPGTGGRRLPPGPASVVAIEPKINNPVAPNQITTVTPVPAPANDPVKFAFWSIVGSEKGALVSTDPTFGVPVGTTNAAATAWYLPVAGGPGPVEPALLIDAFDVTAGWWSNADFVDVITDPALTFNANELGVVPLKLKQDVRAYAGIANAPFVDWKVLTGSESVNGRDLHGDKDTRALAVAFYRVPDAPNWAFGGDIPIAINLPDDPRAWFDGPVPGVDPMGEYLRGFARGLILVRRGAARGGAPQRRRARDGARAALRRADREAGGALAGAGRGGAAAPPRAPRGVPIARCARARHLVGVVQHARLIGARQIAVWHRSAPPINTTRAARRARPARTARTRRSCDRFGRRLGLAGVGDDDRLDGLLVGDALKRRREVAAALGAVIRHTGVPTATPRGQR